MTAGDSGRLDGGRSDLDSHDSAGHDSAGHDSAAHVTAGYDPHELDTGGRDSLHHDGGPRGGYADVILGPFTTPQLLRLDDALRAADDSTGLAFSVYVGDMDQPVRGYAEKLLSQLPDPDASVLIAVSPNQRVLEIVTGQDSRRRVPDRATKLAALSMVAAFGGGDLAGGLVAGLAQLAGQAARHY